MLADQVRPPSSPKVIGIKREKFLGDADQRLRYVELDLPQSLLPNQRLRHLQVHRESDQWDELPKVPQWERAREIAHWNHFKVSFEPWRLCSLKEEQWERHITQLHSCFSMVNLFLMLKNENSALVQASLRKIYIEMQRMIQEVDSS